MERSGRWALAVSVLTHAAIILLLLLGPLLLVPAVAHAPGLLGRLGGGGGGGGGGRGVVQERVQYMRVTPPSAAPAARVPAVVPPRAPVEVKPQPVVVPPIHVQHAPAVQPTVAAPVSLQPQSDAPSVVAVAATGAGAGFNGTSGAGPGTGGGTGSGTGSGRGSGSGPGTGGNEGTIYPATPDFAVIPPLPVPKQLQGKTVELRFTLDAAGRVVRFEFDPTGDSGYDHQLRERLGEFHFRPAHRADGTAVPSVFVTQVVL